MEQNYSRLNKDLDFENFRKTTDELLNKIIEITEKFLKFYYRDYYFDEFKLRDIGIRVILQYYCSGCGGNADYEIFTIPYNIILDDVDSIVEKLVQLQKEKEIAEQKAKEL